jgi:hypothetical protein
MAIVSYDEFKRRISIQDLLIDAGYSLNRRDGLRYPSYIRLDSNGQRIHGDKFLVTANGCCCFKPPVYRNYNIISFIKEHPDFFKEYTPGMDKDRLVILVCNRLLNNPIEDRETKIVTSRQQLANFRLDDYTLHKFEGSNRETQKPFYPYFKPRGLNLSTQYAFRKSFFLAERQGTDGKVYRNLAFPMTVPGKEDKIVGLEERGRKKLDGTSYKGIARGSNASEGLWLASPEATKLQDAKRVFVFESAYDAMAFYQILMGKGSNLDAEAKTELSHGVFASTGGNPSTRQLEGLICTAKDATFHIGFDMDEAGMKFAEQFKMLADKENVPTDRIVREETSPGYKDFNEELLAIIERQTNPLAKDNVKDELKDYVDSFRKHPNDIPSVKEVLHPKDGQIDLLPKSLWQLYAHYETLYEDAYTMQHSQLVAPEDKEEIREKALEAGKAFRTELASALGVKEETEAEDEEKKVSAGVDLDADGNVEVNESEETKHHGMRR